MRQRGARGKGRDERWRGWSCLRLHIKMNLMNALTIPFSVQSECQPNTDAVADAKADIEGCGGGSGWCGEDVGWKGAKHFCNFWPTVFFYRCFFRFWELLLVTVSSCLTQHPLPPSPLLPPSASANNSTARQKCMGVAVAVPGRELGRAKSEI